MPDFFGYVVTAKEERPEGVIEQVGLTTTSPEEALRMVVEKHGEGVGWDVRRFTSDRPIANPDAMHVHFVYEQAAPKRYPMQSANDLYAMARKLEDSYEPYDPCSFRRFMDIDTYSIPEDANKRVAHRIISDPYIDGYRVFTLGSLWLDGKPFAITQEGGRGGKDQHDYFVTDKALYLEALTYLLSLYAPDDPQFLIIDPNKPMRELTDFYSGSIPLPQLEED